MLGKFSLFRLILPAFLAIAGCAAPASGRGLQDELDALGRAGGGTFRLPSGQRVTVAQGVVLPRGVTLDLNGGELVAVLTEANAAGVRMLSNTALRNGTVTVSSRGSPGTQAGAHAPVLIGALYGENPSADRISPFEAPSGWVVSGVTLRSDKLVAAGDLRLGASGIQVVGGAHHGLIENVTIPSSSRMAGGVLLDWGTVGPIGSGDVPASAAAFRAGRAWTTHPHDIQIRGVTVGALTRPAAGGAGSFGVRFSGVHDVTLADLRIDQVTEAAFLNTAGDLGFEFALAADRNRALRGIVVDGINAARAGAYLVRSDSYADNVGRAAAQGYRPQLPPIGQSDIVVRNVSGTASGSGQPGFGLRLDHQRGGTFADISARGFRQGFVIDEQVYDVELVRPMASDSLDAAIAVQHPSRPPAGIKISDPRVNGVNDRAKSVIIGRSDDVTVSGATGMAIRVTRDARRAVMPAAARVQRD
jgi:hypothetical protein